MDTGVRLLVTFGGGHVKPRPTGGAMGGLFWEEARRDKQDGVIDEKATDSTYMICYPTLKTILIIQSKTIFEGEPILPLA